MEPKNGVTQKAGSSTKCVCLGFHVGEQQAVPQSVSNCYRMLHQTRVVGNVARFLTAPSSNILDGTPLRMAAAHGTFSKLVSEFTETRTMKSGILDPTSRPLFTVNSLNKAGVTPN